MELGILGTLSYLGSNYQSVNEEDNTENNYHPVNLVYHDDNYKKNIDQSQHVLKSFEQNTNGKWINSN